LMGDCRCRDCPDCFDRLKAERAVRILPFETMLLLPGDRLFEPVRKCLPESYSEGITKILLEEHPGKGGRHRACISTPENHRYCGAELALYQEDLERILTAMKGAM
jgi:hypothetical protein